MRINYNVSSIIARNALNNNDKRVAASTQRLSSGCKINSAADNAAGLAIARRMNAQIKSLNQANQNANDGLSAVNTADGAMGEMHEILQRMNELAIQSANGTNSESDRGMIQEEIDQLVEEIDRIAATTEFNAQKLLDGSFAYKGYTNCENAKVMSYTDGVATGTYVIGQLTYYHYEDKTTQFIGEKNKVTGEKTVSDITHDERFSAGNADDVKGGLVTSTSISDYSDIRQVKPFPDGSKVLIEDENIVIKAENDFEIKLTLNDRTPLGNVVNTTTITDANTGGVASITTEYDNSVTGSSVVTTTSYSSVTNYRNIAVQADDGQWYSIKELNFYSDTDSTGKPIGGEKIFTRFEDDNGRDLKDDLKGYFERKYPDCDITINNVEYRKADTTVTPNITEGFEIEVSVYDKKTGQTRTENINLDFYQKKNEFGIVENPKILEDYVDSRTDTVKTQYTIGKGTKDDCLTIDVTGMGAMVVQVGANSGQYLEIEIPALKAENLGIDGLDVSTEDSATEAINIVGNAINQLSAVRAKIGAYANRLEHTITNLDTSEENVTAAYSRIMDVDMATEMTEYSTVQVLVQASTSMLAQANERPQQVLQLLQ